MKGVDRAGAGDIEVGPGRSGSKRLTAARQSVETGNAPPSAARPETQPKRPIRLQAIPAASISRWGNKDDIGAKAVRRFESDIIVPVGAQFIEPELPRLPG